MDPATLTLFAIVAVIVLNQLARLPFVREHPWVFWSIVAVDGLGAAAVLTFGLPGLVPIAKWMVGALFLFHLVQNLQRRTTWRAEESEARREAEFRERQRQHDQEG